MKILIIAQRYPAVSQTFMRLHVESLVKLGHDVTVMAAPGDSDYETSTDQNGSSPLERFVAIRQPRGGAGKRIFELSRFLPWDVRSVKLVSLMLADYIRGRTAGAATAAISLAAELRRCGNWDIVHVHFGNLALPVAQLCDAGYISAPVVATFHGTDINEKRKVTTCHLFARIFRTAKMLTVGTKHMAMHFLNCGIPSDRYKVIPMGVDLSRFTPVIRKQRNHRVHRLITVGRLIECKGIEYAIRAVAELRKADLDVTLEIIGDGTLRNSLERLCDDLDVSSHVRFHGALAGNQVVALLHEADVYIQPGIVAADGTREGQGVAVAEAQATGLPVVASRVGGIPEMVEEGKSAYLVEPANQSELVEQIARLLHDADLRQRMGAAGREFVEKKLNQENLANDWISIYNSLISVHPN